MTAVRSARRAEGESARRRLWGHAYSVGRCSSTRCRAVYAPLESRRQQEAADALVGFNV